MYDHTAIEEKWRVRWAKEKRFEPSLANSEKPFYNLMMFPYPSGEGLHVGHTYSFGGADAYGRYQRLRGYAVFEPMGFDAFGIHSENFAIKQGLHPRELIEKTTEYYREKQMKQYGGMWDWSHQVDTTHPDYYRWTQWIFVQLFKGGLVERKKQALNWCPSCKTVLSDEQVEMKDNQNVCERCKSVVGRREMEQWFFKITDYAEQLLDYHGTVWPDTTRQLQTNWIGRSQGATVQFQVSSQEEWQIEVYTTRPDTLFGATFFVLAPEHPAVARILGAVSAEKKTEISTYLAESANKSGVDRAVAKDKTGVDTGLTVTNPVNGVSIPIFIADYVLMEYGTGAIMGVPAHDQRDWEFAKKYNLKIIPVIKDEHKHDYALQAWDGRGKLINSAGWNGWEIPAEMEKVIRWLEKKDLGRASTQYKLRDWCISRQRYWGPPIPMIYCAACAQEGHSWFTTREGRQALRRRDKKDQRERYEQEMSGWYPVAEESLPVELPFVKDYQPKGEGVSPLATVPEFYQTVCPHCGRPAVRETDVSDTFLDSSWYFLRYPSVGDDTQPFDPALTKKWLPVDMYIGGNEHACLHLLYARFVTMALHDLGWLEFKEPFKRFYAHGLIIKDGAKMSKSRGNVVNPEEYMEKFGADTLRMYLLFLGPLHQGGDFRDTGMRGMRRYLQRLCRLCDEAVGNEQPMGTDLRIKLHRTIKKMGHDYARLKFNTAIAALMELTNLWQAEPGAANREMVATVARLAAPIAPYLSEEFWSMSGGSFSVLDAGWPAYEEELLVKDQVTVAVQINGKTRGQVRLAASVASMKTETDQEKVLVVVHQDAKLGRYLEEKEVVRTVFVPGRLVNVIVGE